MTDPSDSGYPEPPAVGDEASTLLGSLERQRPRWPTVTWTDRTPRRVAGLGPRAVCWST